MSKSIEKLSPDDSAANYQRESSIEEKRNDNQSKKSEDTLLQKFKSFQKEVENEIGDGRVRGEKNEEKLKLIQKKLKKVESSLQQYENQQKMDKKSSFSQQQWHLELQSREMSESWKGMHLEKHILVSPMIMSNLQISYNLLPSHFRLNLLCFAVFPEKAIIKKRPLIYWWTAEQLITKSAKKTAQEVAEEIFQGLIDKNLIQSWYRNDKIPKSPKSPKSPIRNCTVNPWIRTMLVSIATRVGFFDFDEMGKVTNNFIQSRCLCLAKDNNWFLTKNNLRELEKIFNVNESVLSFKEEFFLECKKLRVLQLGRWQASPFHHIEVENDKFLNELRVLKRLRYLSLRGISRISTLPSSITECQNLEILDLKACHNLESLPVDLSSWRKLTHLDMSECYLLETMPYGLEKLSSLQVLKGVIVGEAEGHYILRDLAFLKKLAKLSLVVRKNSTEARDEIVGFSQDSRAENLKNLTISWRMDTAKEEEQPFINYSMDDRFLKKLEKLVLRCYPYRKSPDWLQSNSLGNLKKLYIRGGKLGELISPQEWGVEILRLKYLDNLKLEETDVKKMFPHLILYDHTEAL